MMFVPLQSVPVILGVVVTIGMVGFLAYVYDSDQLAAISEGTDATLEQSYGFDIPQENILLRAEGDELSILRGDAEEYVTLHQSEIDFEGIEVSSERDFEAENRSRAMNYFSLVHEDDMATDKAAKSVIRIPKKDSNAFIVVSPRGTSDGNDLLDAISSLDPTID